MALVICCVFLTERIRRRMSIRLGIDSVLRGGLRRGGGESLLKLRQHVLDVAL